MRRTVLIMAVFLGVFVCGTITGAVAARLFWAPKVPPKLMTPAEEGFSLRTLRRLDRELALTTKQAAAIEPLVEQAADDLRRLRKESIQETSELLEAMNSAIAKHLTPEQRERFATLKMAQSQRIKLFMEERKRRANEGERGEPKGRMPRPEKALPPEDEKDSR